MCTPINAGEVHLPDWQSTNAGKPSSTSSYTYKFTTSSSGSTLSFDWSVSSEENFDFLIVTLDGTEILIESGINSSSYSVELYDNNEHELVCTYTKDFIGDNGDDCAFISNVIVKTVTNNTLYYTSSDGKIVTPYGGFGANIVSNTYKNGQGIITCDGDVTILGWGAFRNCSSLTSIQIPNTVTSISSFAFEGCRSLESIKVNVGNTYFDSRDNCNAVIETATNSLILGCRNTVIPKSVESIADNAFYRSGLTSIEIPSVTRIGESAFYGCSDLTSITLKSVSHIGKGAFSNCTSLTSITLPNSVVCIEDDTFADCYSLTSVTTGSIGWIGKNAFRNCGFKSFNIPNSVWLIDESAFEGCSLTSITIPNSIRTLERSVFKGCYYLSSVTLSNSITDIGDYAFEGCTNLKSVTIPNSVFSIGNHAFENCSSLASITIPNSVICIGELAFYQSGLTSITIPNSVTSIGYGAFNCCWDLISVSIPNSVENLSEANPFAGDLRISTIIVDKNNSIYDSRDNCNAIIETATNKLITGCKNTTIPNSVTSIGKLAFSFSQDLTSIIIPNSVTTIEEDAFSECGLTSITIPNSVTNIGRWAFRGCSSLTSITIPTSVTSIGGSAFSGCSGLVSVTNLSTAPQNISDWTFSTYGTLHVLPGCKEKYQTAGEWNKFTIVEDAVDPFASIELADSKTYNEATTQENKEISYTRAFNNTSWQSLYIPFSMTYDDWKDDFEVAYINGIRQMDTDDDGAIDETIMDVVKIKSGSLIPNTPYLIKAKTIGNKTITVNNATLYKAESNSVDCSTTIAKYTFTGTYSTIPASTLLANNYYAMGGGSLIMTDGASDLKPFRWYLNVESRSPMYNVSNGAKSITINVVGEEEATGISQMSSDREHSSAIYDLNGRRMSQKNMKSGLYIKNGKKIIIK